MQSILFLLLLILLTGCASSQNSELTAQEKGEFDSIKNSDFTPIPEVPFKLADDGYKSTPANDLLASETIAKSVETNEVEKGVLADPIGAMAYLCYQKKFDEAFKVADQSYPKFKNHPSYWNQLGTCYLFDNQTRSAILYYNKATELKASYVPALNNIGVLLARKGEYSKALLAFKKASEANPFSLTPLFNLGVLYLKFYQVEKAGEILRPLHDKNSNDPDLLNAVANLELMEGRHVNALSYFQKIPKRFLVRSDISLNYALALKLSDRVSEAKAILDQIRVSHVNPSYQDQVSRFVGVR